MKNNSTNRFQLDRIAFYGRTLAEYFKMFDLDLSVWKGCRILDCPSGASSFVAEANRQGIRAAGCDPLFGDDPMTLFERGKKNAGLGRCRDSQKITLRESRKSAT